MTPTIRVLIVLAIALFVLGAVLHEKGIIAEPLNGQPEHAAPDKFDACYIAQQFLEKRLKAPATAKFQSCREATVIEDIAGTFTVNSFVDAQNSFGALIRTNYAAKVVFTRYDEKGNQRWRLEDISTIP